MKIGMKINRETHMGRTSTWKYTQENLYGIPFEMYLPLKNLWKNLYRNPSKKCFINVCIYSENYIEIHMGPYFKIIYRKIHTENPYGIWILIKISECISTWNFLWNSTGRFGTDYEYFELVGHTILFLKV